MAILDKGDIFKEFEVPTETVHLDVYDADITIRAVRSMKAQDALGQQMEKAKKGAHHSLPGYAGLTEWEIQAAAWLSAGAVDPPLTFAEALAICERDASSADHAYKRILALSGRLVSMAELEAALKADTFPQAVPEDLSGRAPSSAERGPRHGRAGDDGDRGLSKPEG